MNVVQESLVNISTSFSGQKFNAIKDDFDREQKKQYFVPIVITDSGSPRQTGTSTLVVIIGGD